MPRAMRAKALFQVPVTSSVRPHLSTFQQDVASSLVCSRLSAPGCSALDSFLSCFTQPDRAIEE